MKKSLLCLWQVLFQIDARADRTQYSPYINDTYPDTIYYGDTHVHTSYSTDAGFFGKSPTL
ncbi:MAG: DUF3604 domain-containing protein [Proteobacteria bacterium]|nr:DUF3604 domain-containing protein [Pseudomonadota bacterium]